MWIVWCGAYYGWTPMVLNIECSGVCEDTCGVLNDNGICEDGGHEDNPAACEYGADCADCGARMNMGSNLCSETPDFHGYSCHAYHQLGYTCHDLVFGFGRDCACTCPELYLQGADNLPVGDVYTCPCPDSCTWQVSAFDSSGVESCECHNC